MVSPREVSEVRAGSKIPKVHTGVIFCNRKSTKRRKPHTEGAATGVQGTGGACSPAPYNKGQVYWAILHLVLTSTAS